MRIINSTTTTMSLAQRRTTLDGIEPISLQVPPRRATVAGGEEGIRRHLSDGDDDGDDTSTAHQRQQSINEEEEDTETSRDPGSETPVDVTTTLTVPAEDGKEIWRTISYDPFGTAQVEELPELQHYESFPAELGDNVAAYEVSAFKRAGECLDFVLIQDHPLGWRRALPFC